MQEKSLALLQTVWVTLALFSDFWKHASEDLEAEIFLIPQPVGPALNDPDLVVQPFDKAQRHSVFLLAIQGDAAPNRGFRTKAWEPIRVFEPTLFSHPRIMAISSPRGNARKPQKRRDLRGDNHCFFSTRFGEDPKA